MGEYRCAALRGKMAGAVSVVALALVLASSVASAETLWQALRTTHANNPKLNSERARSLAEAEKPNAARSGYFPQLNASADYGYARNGFANPSITMPRGFGLSATQAIYNPRLGPENAKAAAEAEAAIAATLSVEQQVLLDATQAFLSVIRERRTVGLRQNAIATMRTMQVQAQTRQKEGDLTRTSVDQTRARVAEVEADLAQSQADKADAEALFRMIIGAAPQSPSEPSLHGVRLPRSVEEAVAAAESGNPKIAAALANAKAADSAIDVAKAGYLPSLGAEGSYRNGYEDNDLVGKAGQNATVRLKLSVPIFNGGLTGAQVRQAEKTAQQRNYEVEDIRKNVRRAVESAFFQHHGAVLRRAASQRRVEASQSALKGLEIEFNAGNAPLYTVLDGRREVVNAQVALARANYDVTMTSFVMLAAMGRFDLARISGVTNDAALILAPSRAGDITASIQNKKAKVAAAPLPQTSPVVKAGENAEIPLDVETASEKPALPLKANGFFSFGFLKSKQIVPPTESAQAPVPEELPSGAPMKAPTPKARPKALAAAAEALNAPDVKLEQSSMPEAAPAPRPRGLLPLLIQRAKAAAEAARVAGEPSQ